MINAPLYHLALGAGLLVAACGPTDGEQAPTDASQRSASLKAEARALPSDPATAATSGYCMYTYSWNTTRARVYHPSNGGCARSVYSPLVVILHAAGTSPAYAYTDYHYLQRHLARNGFISASIDVVADSTQAGDQNNAADEAWAFVTDYLWANWSKNVYIDPSQVALIGHSRGGDTVRYLAHKLQADPLFNVKAVVSLASATGAGMHLDGGQTEAYLQIYGTNDGDTAPNGTYRFFDQAGDNDSQFDPVWNGDVVYKSVKLMEDASHRGYSDLGSPVQQDTVKGYILAYLAAHTKGDVTWYEDYIRGDAVPGGWTDTVYTSYSDGFYRRVIDNFDDGFLAGTTIGGVVSTIQATAQVFDPGFPHETDVLWAWGQSTAAALTWTIPEGKRNADPFKWLSLRIAQLSGAPSNDLRIQIRNGAVWSPEIRLTDYGAMPQPTSMCYGQLNGATCLPDQLTTVEHMATIRVPLSAFGAHDDVQFVRIRFRGDSVIDTFMLDNLEFSEWVFKP